MGGDGEGEGYEGEDLRVDQGAFPAMQSLKGEPRHYVLPVVHGSLPLNPRAPRLRSLLLDISSIAIIHALLLLPPLRNTVLVYSNIYTVDSYCFFFYHFLWSAR